MSNDFLSNFKNENYNKKDSNKEKTVKEKNISVDEEKDDLQKSINKKSDLLEKIDTVKKDDNKYTKHVEHDVVIDDDYSKKQKKKFIIIGLVSIVSIIILFIIFKIMNSVQVINLIDKELNEVNTWALKNNITLDINKEYNDKYDKDIIFEQSKKEGTKIDKGSVLKISVSMGSDPNTVITVPDFSIMSKGEINVWIEDNNLMDTSVVYTYDDTVEKDKYIKHVYKDDSVSDDYFKRSNGLTIYVSKGNTPPLTNISVPDFNGKTKTDVDTWASTNKIVVNYTYQTSSTIPKDSVISQSIKAEVLINEGDIINIVISSGVEELVPDFSGQSKNDVMQWAVTNSVTVNYSYEISNTVSKDLVIRQTPSAYSKKPNSISVVISLGKEIIVPDFSSIYMDNVENEGTSVGLTVNIIKQYRNDKQYGAFISQSISKNTSIKEGGNTKIDVYYSLGKPYIENYIGLNQKEATEAIYALNTKGANLKYEFVNVATPDTESIGKIAGVCYVNGSNCYTTINMYVDLGLTIRMEVYR